MNCVIVDDDELSRSVLEDLINDTDGFSLVASCESGVDAFKILQEEPVDLLFLDIEMPKMDGMELIKNLNPLRILQIPSPEDLYAVIVHQQIEIKTSEARSVLPAQIKLKDATTQWANLGSLIHALHTNDYALIGECLEDVVAEPYRSKVIPAYKILKKAAKTAGALGTSISGSGPSIFSLCKGIDIAKEISSTQKKVLNSLVMAMLKTIKCFSKMPSGGQTSTNWH